VSRIVLRTLSLTTLVALAGCGSSGSNAGSVAAVTTPKPVASPLPANPARSPASVADRTPDSVPLSPNGHCSAAPMDEGLSAQGFTQNTYISYNSESKFVLAEYTITFDSSKGPRPAQTPIRFCLPTEYDLYQLHIEDANLVAVGKSYPTYSTGSGANQICTNDPEHDPAIGYGQFFSIQRWSQAFICGPPGTYTIITLHHDTPGDAGDGPQQRTTIVIND
jgi:hypothetical protein